MSAVAQRAKAEAIYEADRGTGSSTDSEATSAAGGRRRVRQVPLAAAILPQGARGGVIVVDSSIWIDFLNGCAACPATPRAPWHGRDRRGDLMLCKVLQGLDRSVLRSTSGRCSKTPIFPANSKRFAPSSPSRKNNSLRDHPNSALESRRLIPHEGRIAIVTDAGWDVVDAAASGAKRVRRAGLP